MKIVFAGTPAVAVPSLDAIASSGHDIVAVVTRPDAPLGRKRVLTPSPVGLRAEELGLPVLKAARADDELTDAIARLAPDLGVVVAYGALLRQPLLDTPRLGWINLHFSLLPRWRGAAPVQHAVIAGDTVTGASVFQLEAGLDTGPVFGTIEQPIAPHATSGKLLETLSHSGSELLLSVVDALADGSATAVAQVGEVTLAPKLGIVDAAIDAGRSAAEVSGRIRGTTPEPGAFVTIDGLRLKLLDAAIALDAPRIEPYVIESHGGRLLLGTATDPIELTSVHPAGKRPMPALDWWRGRGDRGPVRVDSPS
ncbi:methionyl-tRNA formyltransferase [Amnibacterium flavum]|uniref:Methionyl-tRNA formyltransferase n=1 Tax=Amnibacterium flavum TaxID=2173173 RepID=A0A2V1HPX0_9MICO|nr:methionyl-tRNA formyltransferase [Amnibacterium flavum]PVZ94371.1 methionyl-tRNA formyltransferase [Amnibacterium flavum]